MTPHTVDVRDRPPVCPPNSHIPTRDRPAHPADRYLQALRTLAPLVDGHAAEADRTRRLADPVFEALCAHGLLRLLVASADGGGGLSLSELFTVIEAAARLDGALGWNLCVANVSLAAVVEALPDASAELLARRDLLIAGAIRPGAVTAAPVDGGWRFDGQIGFASGAAHATHFLTASAADPADGVTLGTMRCGLAPRDAVEILDTWHASGLRATSSTHVTFPGVVVPERHVFLLSPSAPRVGALPFASRLGSGLSWVAVGIATRALDRVTALARTSVRFAGTQPLSTLHDVQVAVARARALIASGRAYLLSSWAAAESAAPTGLTDDNLAALRLSYVTATQHAIAATDVLWEAAGSAALYESEGLERCWRDVHAVGQHAMVSARHLGRLGQITLGLPPGPGPI